MIDDKLKYDVGRIMVNLSHAESHINDLLSYYTPLINNEKDEETYNLDQEKDFRLRGQSLLYLAKYDQLTNEDLENHYLGWGMRVVKRNVTLNQVRNSKEIVSRMRKWAKEALFELYRNYQLEANEIEIDGTHYFLGGKTFVHFIVNLNYKHKVVQVVDAFVGEHDNKDEYLTKEYLNLVGVKL